MSQNTMWRFRNTWRPQTRSFWFRICSVCRTVAESMCSKLIIILSNGNSGAEPPVPVLMVSMETWQAAYLKWVDVYVGWFRTRVNRGNMQGQDGPTAMIMTNIGAGKNREKVSVCQTGIKLNYELFFFHFWTANPSTKAMAPPTLSQVLLEASAIQRVNGGCGHFCWPYEQQVSTHAAAFNGCMVEVNFTFFFF